MYLNALTELTPWKFALDYIYYAWWIPVHLKDMAKLLNRHPEVAKEVNDGKFVVHKTIWLFSGIAIYQAHKQNIALIEGDGGAVGLTDNPSALQHWMIAGPEVARVIEELLISNWITVYLKPIQNTMIKPQLSKLPLAKMYFPRSM